MKLNGIFKYCVVKFTIEHKTVGRVVALFDTFERANDYQKYISSVSNVNETYKVVPTSPLL